MPDLDEPSDLYDIFDNNEIERVVIIEEDDYAFVRLQDDEGEWHDLVLDWEDWDDMMGIIDEYDIPDPDIYG